MSMSISENLNQQIMKRAEIETNFLKGHPAKCKTLDASRKFLNSASLCTNNHFNRKQAGVGEPAPRLLSVIIAPPTSTLHLQCL